MIVASENTIEVGDTVLVKGNIVTYSKSGNPDVYETSQNPILIDIINKHLVSFTYSGGTISNVNNDKITDYYTESAFTFTLTAKSGYEIVSVSCDKNGVVTTLEATNNVYTINLDEDVEITITIQVSQGGNQNDSETVSVTFSSAGYSNGEAVTEEELDSIITITFDKGTNSNAPKYYTTGTAVRAYGGNTITVSADGKTIKSITITFGSDDGTNEITADLGTYNNGTWSGSASEVVFTIGGTKGNRRIASISVTYE